MAPLDPALIVARELAGYALRRLASCHADTHRRVGTQQQMGHRLGVHVPLLVLHDLTTALAERAGVDGDWQPATPPRVLSAGLDQLDRFVRRVQSSDTARALARLGPSDAIVTAVVVQVLRPVLEEWPPAGDPARLAVAVSVDPTLEPPPLDEAGAAELATFFALLQRSHRRVEVAIDRLDLDTLRLLSMLERDTFEAPTADDLARLMALFDRPSAHDVVNFALELLPSVLDARHRPTAQVYAVNGYRGLTRAGTLDDLLLTELAYDEDIFLQRYVEHELFYHERERTRDREPEHHLILIDATAGMRGLRDTFARGVALALIQKLVGEKHPVSVAFFDSALRQRLPVRAGSRAATHVLCFTDGRGRDYVRAFEEVWREASRFREESRDQLVITFITHGRCLVPLRTMADIVELAQVFGVFVHTGSTPFEPPEYAKLLSGWQVVDEAELAGPQSRRNAAQRVLELGHGL